MSKLWVGYDGTGYRVFRNDVKPSESSHGQWFTHCVGPFRTVRGACFFARCSIGNPHIRTVADAERIAKEYDTNMSHSSRDHRRREWNSLSTLPFMDEFQKERWDFLDKQVVKDNHFAFGEDKARRTA